MPLFYLIVAFSLSPIFGLALQRGPYLQLQTPTSIHVKFRTDETSSCKVDFGTAPSTMNTTANGTGTPTDHDIELTGLQPGVKYFYKVVCGGQTLKEGSDVFFKSAPETGSKNKVRIWVLGDAGTNDKRQRSTRNGFYQYNNGEFLDLILMLGDNAYSGGSDGAHQGAVFNMYPTVLPQSPVWPTIGNHDCGSCDLVAQDYDYFKIWTLPRNAEAGGSPSGTEVWYSFDFANIHFVVLNSQRGNPEDLTMFQVGGPQYQWLENDLKSTNQDWIIAYWHHPGFSNGGYNSDTHPELERMRKTFIPLLESYGVDMMMFGHAHNYERSKLIHNFSGTTAEYKADVDKYTVDAGDGKTVPYQKVLGPNNGTVYMVTGSAGKMSPAAGGEVKILHIDDVREYHDGEFWRPDLYHGIMDTSALTWGTTLLEIEGNKLESKFIRTSGVDDNLDFMEVRDPWSLIKGHNISLQPSSLTIKAHPDFSTPASLVSLVNSGSTTLGQFAATSNQSWLSVTLSGTGNSQQISHTVNTTGLTEGIHTAIVTITGANFIDKPFVVTLDLSRNNTSLEHPLNKIDSDWINLTQFNGSATLAFKISGNFKVKMRNPLGGLIKSKQGMAPISFDLNSMVNAPGAYLVDVELNNSKFSTWVIIKNK